jgi:branched-chain amino acid transport system substrate-binding protein
MEYPGIIGKRWKYGEILGATKTQPDRYLKWLSQQYQQLIGSIALPYQRMAGLLVLITDVNGLGLKAAQGLLLTTSFYWDTDDKTREWSNRFFAKMKQMPTMWQAGVYSSVMYYLKAIQAAGTDEPLKVAAKMRDMPVEDFFAHNGRLREDGLMVHDLMLVQVKKPEDSKYPWDYYQILARINGEQAFGPPNPACPLVSH